MIRPLTACAAVLALFTFAPARAGVAAASPTPTQFLLAHDARVRAIVVGSPTDSLSPPARRQMLQLINEAFDFRELSRLSLGAAWDERTEAERAEFVTVYRQIVEERNFDIFVRYHRDGHVAYTAEEVAADGRAVVHAEVPVKQEKKQISYALHRPQAGGPWRIYDITVDGAGTVAGNNRAWSRYLARHSYPQLLEQLRKQLGQLADAG